MPPKKQTPTDTLTWTYREATTEVDGDREKVIPAALLLDPTVGMNIFGLTKLEKFKTILAKKEPKVGESPTKKARYMPSPEKIEERNKISLKRANGDGFLFGAKPYKVPSIKVTHSHFRDFLKMPIVNAAGVEWPQSVCHDNQHGNLLYRFPW